jgi:nucleoside-diphosphate-sugar epimerase
MHNYDKIPIEQTYQAEPDLPATILRLPAVYGPNDYQHRLFPYVRRMVDQRRWIILDEQGSRWRWSRTFVSNAAEAITRAVVDDRSAGRVYNVAEPRAFTEEEWIRAVGEAYGWSGEIVALPGDDVPDHLRDEDLNFGQDLVVDTARIRRELGYHELVEQRPALEATIQWELDNLPDDMPNHPIDYEAEDAALPDLTLGI